MDAIVQTQQQVPQLPVTEFVALYRKRTGDVYRCSVLNFFDFVNGSRLRENRNPRGDWSVYDRFAFKYLTDETRNYAKDLVDFARTRSEKNSAPKTARATISAVKEFFSCNDIELPPKTLKDIRRLQPKGGRRTNFEYIDKQNLGEIIHHLDARGKAFVLMLASSGMRIGEVLALNWVDVKIPDRNKYPNKPTSIFVRTSKTGQSRLVYISRECELALAEWKKISPEFLVFSKRLSENFKTIKLLKQDRNETVFPFSSKTAYVMWNDALKKAGYFNMDTSTNRLQMNIHRLRTFFSVQVASVVGQQVSELLLGHGDAYGGAYTGRSTEQLEQEYIRAEPALTIGTTTFQIETALKKTVELEETVNALNSRDETNRLILEKATSREELILEIMGRMKKK